MKLSKQFKEMNQLFINEMAFNRGNWIDTVRDDFLGGALGEYAKLVISRKLGKKDYWSDEVVRILNNVKQMMEAKTKTKFNKFKALSEAIKEASLFQSQITSAKNECVNKYDYDYKKVLKMDLESKELMKQMIEEFLPEYKDFIEKESK